MFLKPGQKLSHYRILDEIGHGGEGVRYRAYDTLLRREVAVKLPKERVADEHALRNFRREARTLAKINHPNVEIVHDFGVEEDLAYLVTEYVPGTTLHERIAQGVLPEEEVVRLGRQLADGLVAAHAEGIIHRDLKPSNLRVTPEGRLKIVDFGIAKFVAPVSASATTATLSTSRTMAGTLPYMAPEQLRGAQVDQRTDMK